MLNDLINAMGHAAIREVRQWPEKTVQVFHHNDSDGLASGDFGLRGQQLFSAPDIIFLYRVTNERKYNSDRVLLTFRVNG